MSIISTFNQNLSNLFNMEAEPISKNQEQPATVQDTKPYKKGEPKEKRPRPQRQQLYEFNADIIDENTVIPPLPKKGELIPKPDILVIKEKQIKNNLKIDEIIEKKKAVRAEKFKFNRKAHGEGETKYSAFQNEISEVQQLRQRLTDLKVERTELRDRLHKSIDQAKANNEKIKQYRNALKGSRQNFSQKLEHLEHRLLTADITKEEERDLNNEIMLLKRKLREAESSGNIQMRLETCEERKDELDEQISKIKTLKDPVELEYTKIKAELDKKNESITGLKSELNAEKNDRNEDKERHDKEYEAWKEEKKNRLDKLEADITKIKDSNKLLWDQYHRKQEQFWKQKQLIDFIEWQGRVKARKVGDKERIARKAEYEKRDKQREKEDQLKKYLNEIELINFLINYLNSLKSSDPSKVEQKKEVQLTAAELAAKLAADSQWKKEKGLQVIQSKKSKEDEEPEKKYKKQKKTKNENKQEQKFNIPYNVQTMFESLKLLAPSSIEQIDAKINQLKEREKLFERAAQENPNQDDKKLVDQIKAKQGKSASQKVKKAAEEDFPSI